MNLTIAIHNSVINLIIAGLFITGAIRSRTILILGGDKVYHGFFYVCVTSALFFVYLSTVVIYGRFGPMETEYFLAGAVVRWVMVASWGYWIWRLLRYKPDVDKDNEHEGRNN